MSLDSGKIYWMSELNPIEEEEIPDDLETADRYLEIPHKHDMDLGQRLVFRFVEARLPHQCNRVSDIFRHRGAYGRFKELLATEGCLDEWYAFEAEATEQALTAWCRANDIQLVEGEAQQST
ncbi:MAG: UPF0158 family protein [Kofleriaceae bacterium]|nr:UPF0158 family protein [Candidatus Methylomirabilis lanthanidiphila]